MAKRILIFSLNYHPFVGGAEIAIQEITDRISPEEVEFHLIAYRFDSLLPRMEKIGNVTVHRIGIGKRGMSVRQTFNSIAYVGKVAYVPLAAYKARQLARAQRFDAYWAMMSYMLFPIVLLRAFGNRMPYLLTLQEGDPFERVFKRLRIRAVAPLLRYGFRHASSVQAISTFLLAWARAAGFAGKGEVIPNGVDIAAFARTFSSTEIRESKGALQKAEGDIFLVTTSRLVHKNAIDTVIRALPLLPERVRFLVYGDGPELDALQSLAASLQVSERVRFMGQVGHAEMPLLLNACDIFVRPSRSEGMGNSFIEAMAAKLPVIATQEGGIADFLFDAKRNPGKPTTGWAVDANAPDQVAGAVEEIMRNPGQVCSVTETSQKMAMQDYSWEQVARSMKRLFDELTASR